MFSSLWFATTVSLLLQFSTASLGQYFSGFAPGYAPSYQQCPSDIEWLRPATEISSNEAAWVEGRKAVVADALSKYLSNLHLKDFSVEKYISKLKANTSQVPILSLALSGGGNVASSTSVGLIQAIDSRFPDAVKQRTGGILQLLTYLSGLSGGSWPTVSYATFNFPTSDEIIDLWQPPINPFAPYSNGTLVQDYFDEVFESIALKYEAGFPVSLCDFMALTAGNEVTPNRLNATWSGIRYLSNFTGYTMPMPVIQLLVVDPASFQYEGILIPGPNSTNVEVTPFEWGAWQGTRKGFRRRNIWGQPWLALHLIMRAGVRTGSTERPSASNAWNLWLASDLSNGTEGQFARRSLPEMGDASHAISKRAAFHLQFPISQIDFAIDAFNSSFNLSQSAVLTAPYPNPWLGVHNDTTQYLQMVDGSEGGQTIPLNGIMQPARHADLIIAYDASQETEYDWQNGTNLIDSANFAIANNIPFPKIPTAVTILNRNYSTRPTFFGCNASLATGAEYGTPPIVLYIANAPYSTYTNFSFISDALPLNQVQDVLQNSFNIIMITQANGTIDHEWPECLGCAIIQRSLERLSIPTTPQCQACFAKYCWDGVDDPTLNAGLSPFDPEMFLPPTPFGEWNAPHPYPLPV